jgi:fatty-acyl-CoA synthase
MTTAMPTPTVDDLPRRFSDFATLGEALDYAAKGQRGVNFHDMRGALSRAYTFTEMRSDALDMAYRLISHGVKPQDRIALVAETGPDFAALFFGCVYAGAWPVPLPLPTSFQCNCKVAIRKSCFSRRSYLKPLAKLRVKTALKGWIGKVSRTGLH